MIKLLHGDSLDLLSKASRDKVDMILTDPLMSYPNHLVGG